MPMSAVGASVTSNGCSPLHHARGLTRQLQNQGRRPAGPGSRSDGTPYWPDWPTGTAPTNVPSTMVIQPPTFSSKSQGYSQVEFQTDNPASDYLCNVSTGQGCTVPPPGPGDFYLYWSQVTSAGGASCSWEFGNTQGTDFGGAAQYGAAGASGNGYYGTDGSPLMSLTKGGCVNQP